MGRGGSPEQGAPHRWPSPGESPVAILSVPPQTSTGATYWVGYGSDLKSTKVSSCSVHLLCVTIQIDFGMKYVLNVFCPLN